MLIFGSQLGAYMQNSYNEGSSYGGNGIQLGNPNQVGNEFLEQNKSTNHLQFKNDTVLAENGSNALQTKDTPQDLLSKSAEIAVNAREEYDINQNNGFIKGSMEIEANPFKLTGGSEIQQKSKLKKEKAEIWSIKKYATMKRHIIFFFLGYGYIWFRNRISTPSYKSIFI